MLHAVFISAVLLAAGPLGTVSQEACPAAVSRVTAKVLLSTSQENGAASIAKLPGCLGLQDCQLDKYDVGMCGAAKIQRVEGAQKAATLVINPAGCTEVYNCNGVYVDAEVYQAVVNEDCMPTTFGGDAVGLCAGVLLPTSVLQAITCQNCAGDVCKGCSEAGTSQNQCTPIKNCATARKLLQAEVACTAARVSLSAASSAEANGIMAKLESKAALSDLGTCIGQPITSIGPKGVTPVAGR